MAYNKLSTANLPDPAINPAQGSSPGDYFNTVLYPGTGADQPITGIGFKPDWVWLKQRNATGSHGLFDSVRGATKRLSSNLTAAEDTAAGVNSFDADGFTLDALNWNQSGQTFVSWNWKAGTSFSNDAGENGATIASSGKVSTESGFSIASFNSGSAGTQSFKHGLSQVPEIVFLKSRTTSQAWPVWTSLTGNPSTAYGYLNYSNAFSTDSLQWINAPTSTLFTFNSNYALNQNADCIAYCFHSVEGFSKCSSYVGNGNADGPFVYTGFRPSFLLVKRTDGGTNNWVIYDKERDSYNYVDSRLFPNTSGSESGGGASYSYDFLSNGFKVRSIGSEHNLDGGTYIYMAFAENPFKYSNAR